MIKVLITGPESSGKSYLTEQLSHYFKAPMVNEFARDYLKEKNGYAQTDLTRIAIGQMNLEKEGEKETPEFLFCDTGIEVVMIWSLEKFHSVDEQIELLAKESDYDLVLLCKPNIPWKEDPLRENPNDRDRLFDLYVEYFSNTNYHVRIIDAPKENRIWHAIEYVKYVISSTIQSRFMN